MITRHDDGTFVIQEGSAEMFGEFRFGLDIREREGDRVRRRNIGWYRTMRGARNALSMERGCTEARCEHGLDRNL